MDYRDPSYSVRTLTADVRTHLANWRLYKKAAKIWPIISITTYVARFFLIIFGILVVIWCEVHKGLTKGEGFLALLVLVLPAIFAWMIVEQFAWNHDLRQKGISSDHDVWKVSQFPQE